MYRDLIPQGLIDITHLAQELQPGDLCGHVLAPPYQGELPKTLVTAPDSLKDWLREADGGTMFCLMRGKERLFGHDLHSAERIAEYTQVRWILDPQPDYWVIAKTFYGDTVGMLADGRVVEMVGGRRNWTVIAESWAEWLRRMVAGSGAAYWFPEE